MHRLASALIFSAEAYGNKSDSRGFLYLAKALNRCSKAATIDDKIVELLADVFAISDVTPEDAVAYHGIPGNLIGEIKQRSGYCSNCDKQVGVNMLSETKHGAMCTPCLYANIGDNYHTRYSPQR